jgi:cytochrome c biogenesis protein CcmG/thiol:disulfide interchange protein DsbE
MSRGWQVALVVGLLGLFTLFYQGLWGDPKRIPTVLIGTPAPAFAGPEVMSGEHLSFDQFRGKVVLVNFWASWCRECRLEHENLLAINERFKRDPDFVMLGINYQDTDKDAQKYLNTYGTSFKHIRDVKGTLAIDYGVYGVPETFVIDRQGIIRYKWIGPITGAVYTNLTEKVLVPLLRGSTAST